MIRLATVAALAGLALAIVLVVREGLDEVLAALAVGGVGLVWASLFHLVPMIVNAKAWQILVPGHRPPSLVFMTWLVWIREAVNGLLPVARVGGEIISARLLTVDGLRLSPAVASLILDMTLSLITQFLFTMLGMGLLSFYSDDAHTVLRISLGLAATAPIFVALVLVQRYGLFRVLSLPVKLLAGQRWAQLNVGSRRLDRAVAIGYRRRGRLLRSALWQFAAWVAGAGEIWLALYYLGHPVSLGEALTLEALAQAVSSIAVVVPAALGVQEGGFLLFGTLLGLGPEIALALALARRVRDLIVYVPALIALQLSEGRRVLKGA